MIYYAYEVYTVENIDIGVDTVPNKLLLRMAEDLKAADGDGGIERIIICQVDANSKDDAINAVRRGDWLEEGFADAKFTTQSN